MNEYLGNQVKKLSHVSMDGHSSPTCSHLENDLRESSYV